jgi:hypothetical protein
MHVTLLKLKTLWPCGPLECSGTCTLVGGGSATGKTNNIKEEFAMRVLGILALVVGSVVTASAQGRVAPEIDGSSLSIGVALLSGCALMLRSRRKK